MSRVDIRNLDIGMLRTFDALFTERSVSRAAVRLFLSQPAVSSSLRKLREVFDDPLFSRSGHGMEPTPRAVALAPHVQDVLRQLELLSTAGTRFDPATSDRIFRVVGSEHMSDLVLPRLCPALVAQDSSIRIFWDIAANYAAPDEMLQRGHADLGLLPRMEVPQNLKAELLYEDSYVLAARIGRFEGDVDISGYCAAPHVFLGYGRARLDDLIDQTLARMGRKRCLQVAVTSLAQVIEIVQSTDHVSVIPARVAARYVDRIGIYDLPFELAPYRMYLCWSQRADGDQGVQWLKSEIAGITAESAPNAAGLV